MKPCASTGYISVPELQRGIAALLDHLDRFGTGTGHQRFSTVKVTVIRRSCNDDLLIPLHVIGNIFDGITILSNRGRT